MLAGQLAAVERRVADDASLRTRLQALIERCTTASEPTVAELTDTMEAMAMSERYHTPVQQETLRQRHEALGPDGIRAAAQRWADLIEQFTGGDPGMRESLGRMYREQGAERASRGAVSAELMAYVGRALAVSREAS